MILDFTVKNFLSFQNEVSINMLAAKTVKENENPEGEHSNTWPLTDVGVRVLKTAAIYGANGSGKSNIVQAMAFFREMILTSFVNENLVRRSRDMSFRLASESMLKPIGMQMNFAIEGLKYRYGFELQDGIVISEWLFVQSLSSHSKESYCFKREKKNIKINSKIFKGAKGVDVKTRTNALFLSTCAQFNVEVAMYVKEWFRKRFNVISGLDDTLQFTAKCFMHNAEMRQKIVDFVKLIDLGIENINVSEKPIEGDAFAQSGLGQLEQITLQLTHNLNLNNRKINRLEIMAQHAKYDGEERVDTVSLPFRVESLGTNKLFALLGPWFDILNDGGVLVIDEFGASLHTQLSIELIKLFYGRLNVSGSQLIITTHDTNLLRRDLLRRDQIWFTEKDYRGVSDLYSLVEYKVNQATSVRNDASFRKDYLIGKYGAIPYFGNIAKFVAEYGKEEPM